MWQSYSALFSATLLSITSVKCYVEELTRNITGMYFSFSYLTSMSIRELTLLRNVIPKTGRHHFQKYNHVSDILFELWTISHLYMIYGDYTNWYFLSHMANKDKQFEMVNTA